jgi:hypothetical protein
LSARSDPISLALRGHCTDFDTEFAPFDLSATTSWCADVGYGRLSKVALGRGGRVNWTAAARRPVNTVRRTMKLRADLNTVRGARDEARRALAEFEKELRLNRDQLRAAHAELREELDPLRAAVAAAQAEVAAMRRLHEEPDGHPPAVGAAMRAARRDGATGLGVAALAELADAVAATSGVSGELLVFEPVDHSTVVVPAAAKAPQRLLRVLGADAVVRAATLALLAELAVESAAVEFEEACPPAVTDVPGAAAPAVAFAYLGGDAAHTAAALVAFAPRLAPGARIAVGRAGTDAEVAAAVEAFLDNHAGLLRQPGAMLHLVPEPD